MKTHKPKTENTQMLNKMVGGLPKTRISKCTHKKHTFTIVLSCTLHLTSAPLLCHPTALGIHVALRLSKCAALGDFCARPSPPKHFCDLFMFGRASSMKGIGTPTYDHVSSGSWVEFQTSQLLNHAVV